MTLGPDPERLADARRRAAFSAEHSFERRNTDAERVVALDVLAEFIGGFYDGPREQVAWALLWVEPRTDLEAHEQRLRENAWKKVREDADQAEWERLGLNP